MRRLGIASVIAVGLACAGPFDGGDEVLPPLERAQIGARKRPRHDSKCSPWTKTCDGGAVMVCKDGRFQFVEDCAEAAPAGSLQCVEVGYDAVCAPG